ncbi:hypothetical protein TWF694_010795 [Orbilia ellipsospora]|uniref:Uncharacterized protein n=1 Tax=Orbilia ellipsospora TaxID=2528407 RepID=A0AAV9X8A9_9PEZI
MAAEAPDHAQIVKTIDDKGTEITKLYQQTYDKTEEAEIDEIQQKIDPLEKEVRDIVKPLIDHFDHLLDKGDKQPDPVNAAKPAGAEAEAGFLRYKQVLDTAKAAIGERLAKLYKQMNPHASESEIEEIQDGEEPWFYSSPGFEQRSDEWTASRKEYIVRYNHLLKIKLELREMRDWMECVNDIKTFGEEPADGIPKKRRKPKKAEKAKPEKKGEKSEKNGGTEVTEKKKKGGLFARIKLLIKKS